MEEIAVAAEYTRRTLYTYFKSRDEILLLIHIRNNEQRMDAQDKIISDRANGPEKLNAWAMTYFTFAKKYPGAFRLQQYWDYTGIDPNQLSQETFSAFVEQNDRLADQLRAILLQCRKEEMIRKSLDADVCVSQFLYALRAVLGRALSPAYSFASIKDEAFVTSFVETFIRGIRE